MRRKCFDVDSPCIGIGLSATYVIVIRDLCSADGLARAEKLRSSLCVASLCGHDECWQEEEGVQIELVWLLAAHCQIKVPVASSRRSPPCLIAALTGTPRSGRDFDARASVARRRELLAYWAQSWRLESKRSQRNPPVLYFDAQNELHRTGEVKLIRGFVGI